MPPLPKHRFKPRLAKPRLSYARILEWCDEFHERYGYWPKRGEKFIAWNAEETWGAIERSLTTGSRGLPGGTTLAKLLLQYRGRPHYFIKPDITEEQILKWADAWHQRTSDWPKYLDGRIPGTKETWSVVHTSLQRGARGLPGGGSLARFLEEHRGVKNHLNAPPLTARKILKWADDHKKRTGQYPKHNHGQILAAPRETWCGIENALRVGNRGLPGGDSLAKFLTRHRGLRNRWYLPHLTGEEIKKWALAYKERMGTWPTYQSGPIPESNGESWASVHAALYSGLRGMPGGDSLAKFLSREFGRKNPKDLSPLSVVELKSWVLRHHELTGLWPTALSGEVLGVKGETWAGISLSMYRAKRGMTGKLTLSALVDGVRKSKADQDGPRR